MMLQAGTYRGVKGCTAGCVKGCHVHESKPHALAGTQVEGGRVQLRQYGQRWRAVCRCLCFGPLTGANGLIPVHGHASAVFLMSVSFKKQLPGGGVPSHLCGTNAKQL